MFDMQYTNPAIKLQHCCSSCRLSNHKCAGIVPTKFAAALVANPELEEMNKSRTLLGRLGAPGDMAAAVAFLVSQDATYVTGETIVVAGGMQSRL